MNLQGPQFQMKSSKKIQLGLTVSHLTAHFHFWLHFKYLKQFSKRVMNVTLSLYLAKTSQQAYNVIRLYFSDVR